MSALYATVGLYLFFVFGWILYLAVMNVARVRDQLHWFAKLNAYFILLPAGYAVDFVMNLVVCLAFWRLPRDLLLTGTLKRAIINEDNWRCDVAAWICERLLNQFDPKGRHC